MKACIQGMSVFAFLAGTGMAPFVAFAQEGSARIEDIVVTARKQVENVQDVPIAVTPLGSQKLEDASIKDIAEIQKLAPNLFISSVTNGGRAEISIRGQRDIEGTLTSDAPVGVYVDGVNLPRVIGLRSSFVDIDRVDVLRGPQGTLFGKNTTGGAFQIETKKPYDDWGGYVDFSYGNYDSKILTGALNAALVPDKLAVRGVVQLRRQDGYGQNLLGQELNDDHTDSYRLHVLATPTDNISLLLSGDYVRMRNTGSALKVVYVQPQATAGSIQNRAVLGQIMAEEGINPAAPDAIARAQALLEATQNGSFYDMPSDKRIHDNVNVWGVSGTLNIDFDWAALKSITAYRGFERDSLSDYDATPYTLIEPNLATEARNFSQELQLSSQDGIGFDWVAGLYYNRETGHEGNRLLQAPTFFAGNPIITDGDVLNKNKSAFAQVIYALTETVRLTGGIRYTNEFRALTTRNRTSAGVCTVPLVAPGSPCERSFRQTFENWSYLASIDWRPSDNVLLYANTSRGYKAGGFNLRGTSNPATFAPFSPEKATNYEVGYKLDMLDRALRINGSFFYTDYANIQKSTNVNTANGITSFLINAAAAEIYGGEIELTAVPVTGLTLSASGGWTHARYTRFPDAILGDRSGEPFSVPEFTFGLNASYVVPVSMGDLRFNADYAWIDDVNFRPTARNQPSVTQKAYGLLGARAALEIKEHGVEVALFGKNLTNKHYYAMVADYDASFGFNVAFLGEPRTYGIQIRKSFGAER
jgi:iron complex outermembrane receptor protein